VQLAGPARMHAEPQNYNSDQHIIAAIQPMLCRGSVRTAAQAGRLGLLMAALCVWARASHYSSVHDAAAGDMMQLQARAGPRPGPSRRGISGGAATHQQYVYHCKYLPLSAAS
jgi:hypothetical protein